MAYDLYRHLNSSGEVRAAAHSCGSSRHLPLSLVVVRVCVLMCVRVHILFVCGQGRAGQGQMQARTRAGAALFNLLTVDMSRVGGVGWV